MKTFGNNSFWVQELPGLIAAQHRGQYKTALMTAFDRHIVVTRVNYLVICLWVEKVNSIIKSTKTGKFDPITRIGWIEMQKSYRRYVDKELNLILNERNSGGI